MNATKVKKIFEIFQDRNPNPKIELEYKNHFTLLVAVVLSAQATDIGVNKATANLFEKFDTPYKILNLGEEGLKDYVKTINLYPTKAKNIIKISRILIEEYEGQVPKDFNELIKLPGVGRKSANVVLNSLFNHPTIAVDTHVFRVSRRLGLSSSNTVLGVEEDLIECIPKKYKSLAHHWLVLHGRYVCKARKPQCEICPLREYCEFFQEQKKFL